MIFFKHNVFLLKCLAIAGMRTSSQFSHPLDNGKGQGGGGGGGGCHGSTGGDLLMSIKV